MRWALPIVLFSVQALAEFRVPELSAPVVDAAGMIPNSATRRLNSALQELRRRGGSQITVLTIPSLEGETIEQASIRVVDRWQLGGKKEDNGILLMFAKAERKIRIEVGQGLEGRLTDIQSKRIISESISPLMRSGDVGSAVLVGVYQIAQVTDPKIDMNDLFENVRAARPAQNDSQPSWLEILIFLWILFMVFQFLRRGRSPGFLGGFGAGYGMGRWGGSGWGGGSRGGGGGWSGGGGGFSGGGASGDW